MYDGQNFWLHLTTASAQCLRLSERFFVHICYVCLSFFGFYVFHRSFVVLSIVVVHNLCHFLHAENSLIYRK